MAKAFPKKLFVKVEGALGEEYFVADGDVYGLAEMGQKIRIATYQLVEVNIAAVSVEVKKAR